MANAHVAMFALASLLRANIAFLLNCSLLPNKRCDCFFGNPLSESSAFTNLICGYGEMANALDSGSSGKISLQVQVLLSAP